MSKEMTAEEKDKAFGMKTANACIGVGVGVGVVGLSVCAIGGVVCPLCYVVPPTLIGAGFIKRHFAKKSDPVIE